MNDSVTLLLNCRGATMGVYASKEAAEAVAARFNADPWLDVVTPDPDAPYSVVTWAVQS